MLWVRFGVLLELLSGVLLGMEYLIPHANRIDDWIISKLTFRPQERTIGKALYFAVGTGVLFIFTILVLGALEDYRRPQFDSLQFSLSYFLSLVGFSLGVIQQAFILWVLDLFPTMDRAFSFVAAILSNSLGIALLLILPKLNLLSNNYLASIFILYIFAVGALSLLVLSFPFLRRYFLGLQHPVARMAILLFIISKLIGLGTI